MKKLLFVSLVAICAINVLSQELYEYGNDKIDNKIIKGVWSQDDGMLIENAEYQLFSWGEGRIIPKISRVIDEYNDGVLFIEWQNEGAYEINKIQKISDNQYILSLSISTKDNQKFSKIFINNFPKEEVINLEIIDIDTIQFTTSSGNRFFKTFIWNNILLYRYSGINMKK